MYVLGLIKGTMFGIGIVLLSKMCKKNSCMIKRKNMKNKE